MARLDLTGAGVSPAICEDIVPDGEYLAVIVRSHLRWTRTRKGRYIQLVVRIIDGDFEGFQIVDRSYVESRASAGPVDEGRRKLAGLCAATGVARPKDTSEFHGVPVRIIVRNRYDRNGSPRSEIREWKEARG